MGGNCESFMWRRGGWEGATALGRRVYYNKLNYTPPAVRSKNLSKVIFASCMCYSDRALYGLCVPTENICQRLPLQLQRSYQGQQVMLVSLFAETKNPFLSGTKSDS